MKPQTKYTKSGRINIAYQVIGSGDIDIVYVPGWVSNIDLMWECPQLVKFLTSLSKIARVILFDKRGTGLSDRVTDLSSLEDRMDDIRAVMDAVGSQRAVLFGHSEGGSVSALYAATYPDRTHSLVTFGAFAKRRYAEDYPWAPTVEERQAVYDMIESDWGSGDMDLASLVPSMVDDQQFMDWVARYFRSGASPSAALALTKVNTEVDVIDILDSINVPTLLMCRTGDIDAKIEESRFMAERIKGAKMVEFDGIDHFFWAGEMDEVLSEIVTFITGVRPIETIERMLSTILHSDIVDVTDHLIKMGDHAWSKLLQQHNDIIRRSVTQYRGKIVKNRSGNYLATFDGPSKAVHCAMAIRTAISSLGIELKQGIHTGECIVMDNQDIGGLAVHKASSVQVHAEPSEILITQTVKNLLSGAGLAYDDKGLCKLKDFKEGVHILAISEEVETEEDEATQEIADPISLRQDAPMNHSLLENVLQSIDTHMSDEDFGIEQLCLDVGLSERQLQRKLKSISNKTPSQMVRSVRLHRAKEIITSSDEGISQAAYKTGFSSVSYFTKCFRKEFGIAPTELAF